MCCLHYKVYNFSGSRQIFWSNIWFRHFGLPTTVIDSQVILLDLPVQLFTQSADHMVTAQSIEACGRGGKNVKLKFKASIWNGRRLWTWGSILETPDLRGLSRTAISRVQKRGNIQWAAILNCWCVSMWELRENWADWLQMIGRQQLHKPPLVTAKECRLVSLDTQHVEPWRWAPAAGHHPKVPPVS